MTTSSNVNYCTSFRQDYFGNVALAGFSVASTKATTTRLFDVEMDQIDQGLVSQIQS